MLATARPGGKIRPPAVAGAFYPADPRLLRWTVARFLEEAVHPPGAPVPKGLIVPHAGYEYSGPVAASGYALLKPIRGAVRRVVLLGPSHRVPFYGVAVSGADAFRTPLGDVPVDTEGRDAALGLPQVELLDEAHRYEHSLEVQLPFLQLTLDDFTLVPLAVGQAGASEVAEAVDAVWGGPETLIVVSSDLSHYLDYATAKRVDAETSRMIERLEWRKLDSERACGAAAIRGLLKAAERRGLRARAIDVRNSGDTSGGKQQVVGYGSYAIY